MSTTTSLPRRRLCLNTAHFLLQGTTKLEHELLMVMAPIGTPHFISISPRGTAPQPLAKTPKQDAVPPIFDPPHESVGNAAHLLWDPTKAWTERLRAVASASAVFIKTYEFVDDAYGQELAEILRKKAQAGCPVVIIFDFKGTAGFPRSLFNKRLPAVLCRLAILPNVVVVPCFVPVAMHQALLPCDHKKWFITLSSSTPAQLIIGGLNVGARYFAPRESHGVHPYRDTDIQLTGPVVRDALAEFEKSVAGCAPHNLLQVRDMIAQNIHATTFAPRLQNARIQLVTSSPYLSNINRTLEDLIDRVPVGETVLISQAYFLPKAQTVQAMLRAARRGVKFLVLANSRRVHDPLGGVVATAGQSLYRRMWRVFPAGSLRVFEWRPTPDGQQCAMHQKAACFGDSGPVWVGSANLDAVSADKNCESVVVVESPQVNREYQKMFAADLARPNVRELTPQRLQLFNLPQRLWQNFVFTTLAAQL